MGSEHNSVMQHLAGQINPVQLILAVVLLSFVPIVGITIYHIQSQQVEQKTLADLQAIVSLKSAGVERWLDERYADANFYMYEPSFLTQVEALKNGREHVSDEDMRGIHVLLNSQLSTGVYSHIVLLDLQGQAILPEQMQLEIPSATKTLLSAALESKSVKLGNPAYQNGVHFVDMVAPLSIKLNDHLVNIGAVLFRIDMRRFYAFFQRWPGDSTSGELELLRRENGQIVFISTLRHADTIRTAPLGQINLATQVVTNPANSGVVKANDYRNIPVFAAYIGISGTNWRMLAKIDQDEAMAKVSSLLFWVSLVVCSALLVCGSLFYLLWLQRRDLYQLALTNAKFSADVLLRSFFDLSFAGMAIISPDSKRFEHCNLQLASMLGYEVSELLQKTWFDIIHSVDLQRNQQQLDALLFGEVDGFCTEMRYVCKNGSLMIVDVTVRGVRNRQGRIEHICVALQDVGERKQIELALQTSAGRFRNIIESIPVPLLLSDERGDVIYLNDSFVQILGYQIEDIPTLLDWWQCVYEDENAKKYLVPKVDKRDAVKVETDISAPLELSFRCKNGEARTFLVRITEVEAPMHGAQILTLIDITERKNAEASLRKLSLAVEQSPLSIVITDIEAKIEYVNGGFVKHSGYSAEEAIGRNPRMLRSGKNTPATYQDMWEHLTRGEIWRGELINRRKDGREYVESVQISPLRQSDGRITHYVAIKDDITQRKLAEAELSEKLEELRRWHDASMGREMRIIELKNEVNELLTRLGETPRYFNADWMAQWDSSPDSQQSSSKTHD